MSVVKNTVGSDTAMTIVRLQKNVALASPPLPSGHPLIGVIPKYYVQLNNCAVGQYRLYDTNIWTHASGDTVVIKCEMDASADGCIYGGIAQTQAHESFHIKKTSYGTIEWDIDGTTVGTATWSEGIHLIGWLGVDDNGTKKVQPWYDGAVVPGSTASTLPRTFNVMIGGLWYDFNTTPVACIQSPGSWAIRIYEVVANNSNGSWHLYAGLINGNPIMFETRNKSISTAPTSTPPHRQIPITQGESEFPSSVSAVDFPDAGYGVQLHDLKILTGSGYNDLLAIVAEDGGIDGEAGWTSLVALAPYKLTKASDLSQYPFAFWLGGSGQSGAAPIPNGYTRPSGSTEVGLLQMGRKPKWSIWNDSMKIGFYVSWNAIAQNYKLNYNIFKRINVASGQGGQVITGGVDLRDFENYNSAENHPPYIQYSSSILNCYIHNGEFVQCLENDAYAGGNTLQDDCRVFKYNNTVGQPFRYRIGNLAPWNYTDDELANYGLYSVIGVKFSVHDLNSGTEYFKSDTYNNLGYRLSKNNFSVPARAAVANILRNTGVSTNFTVNETNKWGLLPRLYDASSSGYQLSLVGELYLKVGDPGSNGSNLDVSSVFKHQRTFSLQAVFNNKLNVSSSNFRTCLDTSYLADDTTQTINPGYISGNLQVGVVHKYNADTTKPMIYNETSYSCLYLPVMRCGKYTYHSQAHPNDTWEGIYEYMDIFGTRYDTPDTFTVSSANMIDYLCFVEVFTSYNETEIRHYCTFIRSMNGMKEFKKYCDYGSLSAYSRISGWPSGGRNALLIQSWGTTNVYADNVDYYTNFKQTIWKDKEPSTLPVSDPTMQNEYAATAYSTKMFVVPRGLLRNDRELDNNTTAIFHLVNTDAKLMFASVEGYFKSTTYQKYIYDSHIGCAMVFTQPVYKYTINSSNYPVSPLYGSNDMKWIFRTYKYMGGSTYQYCSSIFDQITADAAGYKHLYVYLSIKNGDVNYDALAAGHQNAHRGTLVASFDIKLKNNTMWEDVMYQNPDYGYCICEYDNIFAFNPPMDFYKWGNELDNAPFETITITMVDGSNRPQYAFPALYELIISTTII